MIDCGVQKWSRKWSKAGRLCEVGDTIELGMRERVQAGREQKAKTTVSVEFGFWF
jgi:hypothetical protein